jgi:hypothetical protein
MCFFPRSPTARTDAAIPESLPGPSGPLTFGWLIMRRSDSRSAGVEGGEHSAPLPVLVDPAVPARGNLPLHDLGEPRVMASGPPERWYPDWRKLLIANLTRRADGRWDPLTYRVVDPDGDRETLLPGPRVAFNHQTDDGPRG